MFRCSFLAAAVLALIVGAVPAHADTAPETGDYSRFRLEWAERKIETDPVHLLERGPTENNRLVMRNADVWPSAWTP